MRISWRKSLSQPAWLRSAVQLLWAGLLILHLLLFLSGLGDSDRGLGAHFALFFSTVFFGLKLLDAPFLRLRSTRRAFILYVIVTALVHHDARAAVWDRSAGVPEVAAAVATAVVGALVLAWTRKPILGVPELKDLVPRAPNVDDRTVRPSHLAPLLLAFLPRPPPARFIP